MLILSPNDPFARAVIEAIQGGELQELKRLLSNNHGLATARIEDAKSSRSLLHVATDWPGHFPHSAETVATLIAAGADPNARFDGSHAETPLHWAASSDDVAALDALLEGGADIEAPGGAIAAGSPLCDAVGFGQWNAARRLVERGARVELWHAAALGLMDRIREHFAVEKSAATGQIGHAFWYACHGGQRGTAEYLLALGADLNWVPGWEKRTSLDAAERAGATEMVAWLRSRGAKSVSQANNQL